MSRVRLVTSIVDDEPLEWGLEPHRITVPMDLLCAREISGMIRGRGLPPHVRAIPSDRPRPLSVRDRIELLAGGRRTREEEADLHFWVDAALLYQHLSFEFLYSRVLTDALARFGTEPVYFEMPGYPESTFFGGPVPGLEKALAERDADLGGLFGTSPGVRSAKTIFGPAFGKHHSIDLNLKLAQSIEEPIVHVIGDSHVFNCFTPNKAIGCRANILVNARDVSPIEIPFTFQFTHHLGSRTMHHAGRPGAVLEVANQCGVKQGDAVVWVFGEIDVRCHILKRHREDGHPLDEVVEKLTRDYVRGIREVGAFLALARQVVFAPVPPLENPGYTSTDLPVFGSIEERIAVTRMVTDSLRRRCERHGMRLLEVGDEFRTERGDLRWERSDHFCHVGQAHQGPILADLYRLLAG